MRSTSHTTPWDRHAKGAKKDKVAYIWIPEPTDQPVQKITYGDLYKEVNKFATASRASA